MEEMGNRIEGRGTFAKVWENSQNVVKRAAHVIAARGDLPHDYWTWGLRDALICGLAAAGFVRLALDYMTSGIVPMAMRTVIVVGGTLAGSSIANHYKVEGRFSTEHCYHLIKLSSAVGLAAYGVARLIGASLDTVMRQEMPSLGSPAIALLGIAGLAVSTLSYLNQLGDQWFQSLWFSRVRRGDEAGLLSMI